MTLTCGNNFCGWNYTMTLTCGNCLWGWKLNLQWVSFQFFFVWIGFARFLWCKIEHPRAREPSKKKNKVLTYVWRLYMQKLFVRLRLNHDYNVLNSRRNHHAPPCANLMKTVLPWIDTLASSQKRQFTKKNIYFGSGEEVECGKKGCCCFTCENHVLAIDKQNSKHTTFCLRNVNK